MEKSIDMLGLIGGGLGLANSMFGGIKAAKESVRIGSSAKLNSGMKISSIANITRIIWIDRMCRRP